MKWRFLDYELDFTPTVAAYRSWRAAAPRHRSVGVSRPLMAAVSAALVGLAALLAPTADAGSLQAVDMRTRPAGVADTGLSARSGPTPDAIAYMCRKAPSPRRCHARFQRPGA